MEKINDLKKYLISEFPQLQQRPETVVVHEDDGAIFVYVGSENKNFKMDYKGVVTIYDTTITKAQFGFVLAEWIKQHCPGHVAGSLLFSSAIITDSKKDITFSLPLSETIKAKDVEGAIRLARSKDSLPKETGNPLTEVEAVRGDHDSTDQS